MKRLLIFLTFLAVSGVAYAADPTTDFLEAPYVAHFITLSEGPGNDGKPIVKYTVDNDKDPKTAEGTFRSNGEIAIHVKDFNPLTKSWTVEAKATPDVSFSAIQAFFNDLKTLQDSLPQGQSDALANAQRATAARANARKVALTDQEQAKEQSCSDLNDLIQKAYTALQEPGLTAEELQTYVSEATGREGVTTANADFVNGQKSIQKSIDDAKDSLAKIHDKYGSLGNDPSQTCSAITGQILVDYIQVRSTADQVITAKEALIQQIGELIKILQPFLYQPDQPDKSVWYAQDPTSYVITPAVTPTFTEQQNISVSVKVRTVQPKGNSIVVSTDDANPIAATFIVRKNSFFAAERAAAVIYNNLKYPQYGTASNVQGATVVQRTMDHQPVNGALMLNLVMRLRGLSDVYPFLQLGVSSAKDFPGVLAGLGLRFAAPFNFSISAGGMITRYKDLDDSLKVGDTVTGTDDINKHLVYKTSPVVLYGAMQLKF